MRGDTTTHDGGALLFVSRVPSMTGKETERQIIIKVLVELRPQSGFDLVF